MYKKERYVNEWVYNLAGLKLFLLGPLKLMDITGNNPAHLSSLGLKTITLISSLPWMFSQEDGGLCYEMELFYCTRFHYCFFILIQLPPALLRKPFILDWAGRRATRSLKMRHKMSCVSGRHSIGLPLRVLHFNPAATFSWFTDILPQTYYVPNAVWHRANFDSILGGSKPTGRWDILQLHQLITATCWLICST